MTPCLIASRPYLFACLACTCLHPERRVCVGWSAMANCKVRGVTWARPARKICSRRRCIDALPPSQRGTPNCPIMAELELKRSRLICRADPEALAWTVEALNPQVLNGLVPSYIAVKADLTLDLTWLLVGSKTSSLTKRWDTSQNFGTTFPVRGSVQHQAQTR